jgi:hypothetical protein
MLRWLVVSGDAFDPFSPGPTKFVKRLASDGPMHHIATIREIISSY